MLTRRGTTLVELVIAMALAAVVLGLASRVLLGQRRSADGAISRARAEAQLRAALAELTQALTGVGPAAGDVVGGEARDTALQLRSAVVNGIACDSVKGQAVIAAGDTGVYGTSGVATLPRAGDSLWWRSPDGGWIARSVTAVASGTGICTVTGVLAGPLLRLAFASSDTVPLGAQVRVTRQVRYSFYHAGDGSWQLGIAEWSDGLPGFAPPQPVAGPFTRTVANGVRTGFRYFARDGSELPAGQGVDVSRLALVRLTVVTQERAGGTPDQGAMRDSLDVAVRRDE